MAVFETRNLTKRFGRTTALQQVSLNTEPGVVIALLGENGAGKTTLLKILLGLLEPDDGESQVLGMNSRWQSHEIRQRVGYVPERPVLYPWMTVAELGWFAAGFHHPGYQDEYARLVREFQLPLDRKLSAMSKGMQAKASLAMSLASKPDLLILDEPTSGLDPIVRHDFMSSMAEVAAAGRTVLLSSHQLPEVERVADIVAIIRAGQIVLHEPLESLRQTSQEVIVTLNQPDEPLPKDLPGTLVSQHRSGRQWRGVLRGDAAVLSEWQLRFDGQMQVRTPSLEDLFMSYLHPDRVLECSGATEPSNAAEKRA